MSKITEAYEYVDLGKYERAEELYNELLNTTMSHDDYKSVMYGLGTLYTLTQRYDDALAIYERLIESCKTDDEKATVYHQIGMVYRMKHDIDRAKTYFGYELDIIKETEDNDLALSATFYEFAELYLEEKDTSKALEMAHGALDHGMVSNDDIALGSAYLLLADVHLNTKDDEQAKDYYALSLQHFDSAENMIDYIDVNDVGDSLN